MNEALLPLFPLQVVLFPDALLPLHIFEERYKVLVAECLEGGVEFGVNLLRENEVADVGCTARVASVLRRYEDGRLDIVAGGGRRYRLLRIVPDDRPFAVGAVAFLDVQAEQVDGGLLRETRVLYNTLVGAVYKGAVAELSPAQERHGMSYLVAQKAGLDLSARQRLLELESENERLALLRRYLTGVLPRLSRLGEVERIIGSDGYLQSP